jgi:preprotein translocase subunit SecF
MFIITHKKIFFTIAGVLAAAAIAAIIGFGLTLGIEFTGGSTLEVRYDDPVPSQQQVAEVVTPLFDKKVSVRPAGEEGYIIKTPFIKSDRHSEVLDVLALSSAGQMTEERFSTVGPMLGQELTQKAFVALGVVVVAIILFVAFSFRRGEDEEGNPLNEGVSSWWYGIAAVIALVFDMLLPVGLFAVLGYVMGAEVDVLFVTALLAILGFSVNDTIVVFDRVRERLRLNREEGSTEDFATSVGRSVRQTFARSINTSLTTGIALLALFILGAQVTQAFALTLLVGVIVGTYSSLFLASPLLVAFQSIADKKVEEIEKAR